jgi:hypothetical protein
VLGNSVSAWNTGTFSIAGFNVFTFDNSQTPYVDVNAELSSNNSDACGTGIHGCVRFWDPSTPSGQIYMYAPYLTWANHKQSDLMHEMGHVLLNAGEHYPTYDCTSIMGHSSGELAGGAGMCGGGTPAETLIGVQDHDRQDYLDIYGVKDTPDAT